MKYSNKQHLPICDGCQFESILYCNKFKKECISFVDTNQPHQICCLNCIDEDGYVEKNDNLLTTINTTVNTKAQFHIPSLEVLPYLELLLNEKKLFSYAFYENREINEIYDAFPGAIWNGRSNLFGKPFLSIQDIQELKNKIEALNLHLNLTWNNHLIDEVDIHDKYCNIITEIFHDSNHSITVASPILFKYLKEKYPNFCFYKSVIVSNNKEKFLTPLDDTYDIYLFPPTDNKNFDLLTKIPEENKAKIEFLCDDACFPNCNKANHYNIANYCFKNYSCSLNINNFECPIDWRFARYNTKRWPTTINPEDIDFYIRQGFTHFKMAGRGNTPIFLYYKICKYLVKPEYFDDLFFHGLNLSIKE